jgi:hypothetical protein
LSWAHNTKALDHLLSGCSFHANRHKASEPDILARESGK